MYRHFPVGVVPTPEIAVDNSREQFRLAGSVAVDTCLPKKVRIQPEAPHRFNGFVLQYSQVGQVEPDVLIQANSVVKGRSAPLHPEVDVLR